MPNESPLNFVLFFLYDYEHSINFHCKTNLQLFNIFGWNLYGAAIYFVNMD